MKNRPTFGLAMVLPLLVGVLNCGHPATEKECEEIVARIATLELKRHTSASGAELVDQVKATTKGLQSSIAKECVGRRITERALKCVENAKTADEIVGSCLR